MKIKRSAWHYKISNLGKDWEKSNDNLCIYFWRLFAKCVALLVGIPLILLVLGALIHGLISNPMWPAHIIIFLFVCFSAALPPVVIYFVRVKFGKSPEMPYENIVTEYIKAKKEKICPLIEYTN